MADVVIAFDYRYAMPAAVMLASIERSLRDGDRCTVWAAAFAVDAQLRRRITAGRDRLDVRWIERADEFVAGLATSRHGLYSHIPPSTYITVVLDRIVPPEVTRLVYIDVDTVVRRSVCELAAADLEGRALGAVRDFGFPSLASPGGLARWRALRCDGSAPYLNTGVMVVDIPRWREARIGDRALEYARTESHLNLLDQEALNATLRGEFTTLPLEWNSQAWAGEHAAQNALIYSVAPTAEVDRALERPAIVHYCGPRKPWLASKPAVAFADEWNECRSHTAWRDEALPPARRRITVLPRVKAAARAFRSAR